MKNYLAIDGRGRVWLTDLLGLDRLAAGATIMDLRRASENFRAAVSDTGEGFRLSKMALICGVSLRAVQSWIARGVLVPAGCQRRGGIKIRFSYSEAFAAGVCGAMYRQAQPLAVLRRVYRALTAAAAEAEEAEAVREVPA